MAVNDDEFASLVLMLVLLGVVIAAALFWCLLSSCLGTSVLELLSTLWEYLKLGSQYDRGSLSRRRRTFRDDSELWEMEGRGRTAY